MAHANNCVSIYGREANILLLDFIEVGDGPEAVALMNGVPYNATTSMLTSSEISRNRFSAYSATPIFLYLAILVGGSLAVF